MLKRCILNYCYWGFIYIKNITDFTFHEFYQSGSSSLYIFINQSELSSFGFICFFWYTHLKLPHKIGWQILIILLFGIFFRHDLLNFNVSIYFFYSFTRCQIRLNLIGNDMERQRVRDVSQSFLVEFCIDFFMVTMAFMKTVGRRKHCTRKFLYQESFCIIYFNSGVAFGVSFWLNIWSL